MKINIWGLVFILILFSRTLLLQHKIQEETRSLHYNHFLNNNNVPDKFYLSQKN